jgi:hypothetical protein
MAASSRWVMSRDATPLGTVRTRPAPRFCACVRVACRSSASRLCALLAGEPLTPDIERFDKTRGISKRARTARREQREYVEARRVVAHRAGGQCEAAFGLSCKGTGSEAHHKLRRSAGGSNDPENLLWVCGGPDGCHERIHQNPDVARARGLLLSRYGETA